MVRGDVKNESMKALKLLKVLKKPRVWLIHNCEKSRHEEETRVNYFPIASVKKIPQTSRLKTTWICYLIVLEVRSLNSKCQQGCILPEGSRGESVFYSFWKSPARLSSRPAASIKLWMITLGLPDNLGWSFILKSFNIIISIKSLFAT